MIERTRERFRLVREVELAICKGSVAKHLAVLGIHWRGVMVAPPSVDIDSLVHSSLPRLVWRFLAFVPRRGSWQHFLSRL